MSKLPDESVDLILCDLPYGTTNCKWDAIIPFDGLWKQYNRIAKKNSAIVLFGSEPFSGQLRTSNVKNYKYDWYWIKQQATNFLNAKKQPLRDVETISVFYKSQCVYNPQMKKGKPYTAVSNPSKNKGIHNKHNSVVTVNEGERYPLQTLYFNKVNNNVHPTQKPVDLLEYLIKTYTNESQIVLDNCMGSGSTGVACVNTNRNFIGMELDENYFKIT